MFDYILYILCMVILAVLENKLSLGDSHVTTLGI